MSNLDIQQEQVVGNTNELTEIVYMCSPDRESQLFNSLRTLLNSGTTFDQLAIFCVGKRPYHWNFLDPRIVVEEVEPLFENFFLGNKVHICTRTASRVIFLDTDTFILKPLDNVWQDKTEDFLARVTSFFYHPDWKKEVWNDTLRHIGVQQLPYFNSGFIIFHNQSQTYIKDYWEDYTQKYLTHEYITPHTTRNANQLALSLAVGSAQLSYGLLNSKEHSYAWENDPYEEAIVFHTGGWLYDEYKTHVESHLALEKPTVPLLKNESPIKEKTLSETLKSYIKSIF